MEQLNTNVLTVLSAVPSILSNNSSPNRGTMPITRPSPIMLHKYKNKINIKQTTTITTTLHNTTPVRLARTSLRMGRDKRNIAHNYCFTSTYKHMIVLYMLLQNNETNRVHMYNIEYMVNNTYRIAGNFGEH